LALKLIMLAAGYEEQAPTGTHWASGYMTRAQEDKLIAAPEGMTPTAEDMAKAIQFQEKYYRTTVRALKE